MNNICNTNYPLVDIRNNNVQGDCDYKCEIVLMYKTINDIEIVPASSNTPYTAIGVGEQGVYTDGSPSIIYNKQKYCNIDARIYTPSMHRYQGNTVAGEMIIKHIGCNNSSKQLYVCIPLVSGNGGSTLDNILNRWAKLNKSSKTPFGASFSSFIPKKTYYNYTSKSIWGDDTLCNAEAKYVVFDINDALSMSNASLSLINKVPNRYAGKLDSPDNIPELFKSTHAPGETGLEDIYIDCQPVGASGQTIQEQNMPGPDLDDKPNLFIAKKLIPIIIGAILMYFAYKLITYLLCRLSIISMDKRGIKPPGQDVCDTSIFGINMPNIANEQK